jgi:hypothetical protein
MERMDCACYRPGDQVMALTLEAEQRLEAVGLIEFFQNDETTWQVAALQTYEFIKDNFPPGARIRRDDVAKGLRPVLEVNEALRDKLNEMKLRGKFWISDFADLIIDRTWTTIGGT